jgi:hypothetical protein
MYRDEEQELLLKSDIKAVENVLRSLKENLRFVDLCDIIVQQGLKEELAYHAKNAVKALANRI